MNNGGEFYINEFEELCKKCGIARQNNTLYTPQHNGVVERMSRTLKEKVSMLSGVGLGREYWADAVGIVCSMVNQSLSLALDDKNPHEIWISKKLS
jgi:transposase InsO family protein